MQTYIYRIIILMITNINMVVVIISATGWATARYERAKAGLGTVHVSKYYY